MEQNVGIPVKHVSETAFLVAAYRALESKRPDARFNDPLAERLAGPEGAALVEEISAYGRGRVDDGGPHVHPR